MSHRKMFVSALFKTVFHLIFNAKITSILEITFGISFICNDLDLTDILSKTENALSTAIYQSEVQQLEKTIKFTVRQFAAICLSVKTPQNHPNHPKRTTKSASPASNNLMSPNTPQQTTQHQIWASTRHFGTYRTFAKVLFNMLKLTKILWRLTSIPPSICIVYENSKGPGETALMHRLV